MAGRPKNEVGAERYHNGGKQNWNGKRWISSSYYARTAQQADPAPPAQQPDPAPPTPEPDPIPPAPQPDPAPPAPKEEIAKEVIEPRKPEPVSFVEDDELAEIFGAFKDVIEDTGEEGRKEEEEEEGPIDLTPEGQAKEAAGTVHIKGKHLVFVMDILGSFIASFIVKKAKISNQPRSDFKLSKEERTELAEVAEEAAETLTFDTSSPWGALGISYFALLAFKIEKED
jgi:outer membrane biosynthesis protein TonB